MVEPIAQVVLALPVAIALASAACLKETRWLTFCCQLLTTRLTRVLRFQCGKACRMQLLFKRHLLLADACLC